jgi:hypothetical protein
LSFLLGEQSRLSLRTVLTYNVTHRSSWSISVDDLDLWERVFEQNFLAAGTSTKIVDVIDSIASKCPAIGPRYGRGGVSMSLTRPGVDFR